MFPDSGKSEEFPKTEPELLSAPSENELSLSINSKALSDVPSDIIIKSKIKYGSRWDAFKGLLAEYSKSTSIHGIRYIFEIHRPFYEKIYWIVLMLISLYFATSLIRESYLKWMDSPVIVGFDETLVPVHKIPFPTITICPEIKMETEVFDFANISQRIWSEIENYQQFENLSNITDEERFLSLRGTVGVSFDGFGPFSIPTRVQELSMCRLNLRSDNFIFARFVATLQTCESEVVDRFAPYMPKNLIVDVPQNLLDLAVRTNVTMPFGKWNGRFYFCSDLFKYVLTDEGVCYQFNGLDVEDMYRELDYIPQADRTKIDYNNYFDAELPPFNNITGAWSLDNGYVGQGFNSYPQRMVLTSARNGLLALLNGFEHNFDYTCRNFKQGYKIFLNSPESIPLTTGNYILVPHNDEVLVSIIPHYVMSAKNLHDIEPKKRQCFFNDERYLRYFKSYSQNNCQIECLVNYTISKCGCVKYWMPKPSAIPICSLEDVFCYTNAEEEMTLKIQNQTNEKIKDDNVKIMCDCMPSCNSLDYDFEISATYYNLEKTIIAWRDKYEHSDSRTARLIVYFREPQFTAIKRTIMFSISTLIANCGGIFGLFMGISSLSIIEFVYFFTMRLFSNLRQRHLIKKKLFQQD